MLEYLPPQMHLVIAIREDPHLPLSRLRARGQLTELRATDLRFTIPEAPEFLNQAIGLDLATDDVAALERRIEGWTVGLQLAAILRQGHEDAASLIKSFTGSHRLVLDYLIEEVLHQQPSMRTGKRTKLCNFWVTHCPWHSQAALSAPLWMWAWRWRVSFRMIFLVEFLQNMFGSCWQHSKKVNGCVLSQCVNKFLNLTGLNRSANENLMSYCSLPMGYLIRKSHLYFISR